MTRDEWLISRLPEGLPREIIARGFPVMGRVEGLDFYDTGDRGPARRLYEAADEADLRQWLYTRGTLQIALALTEGQPEPPERDRRAGWMEAHLRLVAGVIPAERLAALIGSYEAALGLPYDRARGVFITKGATPC